MKDRILLELNRLEKEHGIHILYAAESGSRAWGFASPDSDYDVRVIYVHPVEWYLSMMQHKDTFTWFSEDKTLDITGWDLKKLLVNFHKSNCSVYEWLNSPIIYRNEGDLHLELLNLAPDFFNPKGAIHHYLNIAYTYQKSAFVESGEVNLKKYFYVLRPMMAAIWIAKFETPPPMEFDKLLVSTLEDQGIIEKIQALLVSKKSRAEEGKVQPDLELNDFIQKTLESLEEYSQTVWGKKGKIYNLDPILFSRIYAQEW